MSYSSSSSPRQTAGPSSQTQKYATSAALLRMAYDTNSSAKRVAPLYEYFSDSYMKGKAGNDYLKACESAGHAMDGTFNAQGSKVIHYAAYSIMPHNFSDYQGRKDDLALLLRAAGEKGKKAFLDKEPLSLVNTYTLLAAKVPVNKQAEEFFADKPQAIIVGQRNTEHAKDKPRFMHYFKESRINSHSVILPLEFRVHRNYSNLSASEEKKKKQPIEQIPGIAPIREMLEAAGESHLLHPSKEYDQIGKSGVMHIPQECMKWNCSICYSMMHFNEPIKYAAFFGG